MVFRFMNSYLRSAINHRSVRTAYNVLHQYRMLIESLLRLDQGEVAREGVDFLKYYGHIAYKEDLPFITETVAYDLASLCKLAVYYISVGEETKARIISDDMRNEPPRDSAKA